MIILLCWEIFNCNFIIEDNKLLEFCDAFNLTSIVKEPTCYKNPLHPTHIDVILTNRSKNFQNTTTIETGLSDYHKMVITCLKSHLAKLIYYRNYKKFDETRFRNNVSCELNSHKSKNNANYEEIKSSIMTQLEQRAPMKKKFLCANNSPFMNKKLSKAIMTRSRYKNRTKTRRWKIKCNKQRNICVNMLKKAKREYYNNIDIKLLNDNRKFWKCIKPLFSNKQIRLSKACEHDITICNDKTIAEIFNDFL